MIRSRKKVLVVDDNAVFRKAFSEVLAQIDEIEVIGYADDGRECVDMINKMDIDIIFMDIKMPNMNGIEATKRIIREYRMIKVIAISFYDDIQYMTDIIMAGARGFLVKSAITRSDIINAIS